jgi:hypothetical protein
MSITLDHSAGLLIAAAIFSHAWVGRIAAPPRTINIIGWAVVFAMMLTLALAH